MLKVYQRSKIPPAKEKLKAPATDKGVHPFVRWIWLEMNDQQASQEDVAAKAGISSSAMRKWRRGASSPKLADLEAVINVLGYDVVLRKNKDFD